MSDLKYPENLKYTKEHEWVKLEGDTVTMGISDFAQHALTDVVFVELPEVGKKAEAMGKLCTIESVKSVSDIYAPVACEVAEVNKDLEDKPELVNDDCYDRGWIAKLKITDSAEVDKLMSAAEYQKFLEESDH